MSWYLGRYHRIVDILCRCICLLPHNNTVCLPGSIIRPFMFLKLNMLSRRAWNMNISIQSVHVIIRILDVGWQACGLWCIWINTEFKLWPHFHTWWVFTVLLTTDSCACVCVWIRAFQTSAEMRKVLRFSQVTDLPHTSSHRATHTQCTHSDMYTLKHWVKLIKAFLGVLSADKNYTDWTIL